MNHHAAAAALVTAAFVAATPAAAQTAPPDNRNYVTREEYEKLRAEMEAMKKELAATKQSTVTQQDIDKTIEEIEQDVQSTRFLADELRLGTSKFLVTGYTFAGFTDREEEDSTFNAGFNPIIVWKLGDRLLVESELEVELESEEGAGETGVELEFANISYVVNDYVVVGAGKFLTPFGLFPERLHPAWINKLPDEPLVFGHDGIAPFSSLGGFVRGAFPAGRTKFNYAAYVSNGPRLNTGEEEPEEAGLLHFDNFEDINNNKAVGGRIGFLPIPQLELGYSVNFARVNPDDFEDTDALLQGVDVGYVYDSSAIGGIVDIRAEWIWSRVDRATYDPDGSLGFGPVSFSNNRNGGYVQAAYRPSKADNQFVGKLESVVRYDMLDEPGSAPEANDETRVTFGLNYWITPSAVFKTAYQLDDQDAGADQNAFLLQFAVGF